MGPRSVTNSTAYLNPCKYTFYLTPVSVHTVVLAKAIVHARHAADPTFRCAASWDTAIAVLACTKLSALSSQQR